MRRAWDFKLDSRTAEWFNLAMERKLHETISPEDAGSELRQVAREEKPVAILKAWESQDLLDVLHPQLAKRHPDYDAINRITRVRDDMVAAGFRPRLFAPVTLAILGRLKDRERNCRPQPHVLAARRNSARWMTSNRNR